MNLWLPNAPYVEGVIPLYHLQQNNYDVFLVQWYHLFLLLIHVWNAILGPKCSVFSMNSYLKQLMILQDLVHCTNTLCISLSPARVIFLEYLFATFNAANFFYIWFGSMMMCDRADTSRLPTNVRSRHKVMCLLFGFVGCSVGAYMPLLTLRPTSMIFDVYKPMIKMWRHIYARSNSLLPCAMHNRVRCA